MKAVAVSKFKDTPTLMDLPVPEVRPHTVLVKVFAAGINPFDWKLIDGIMNDGKMKHQFPLIMGVDGAGEVEEVGEGVTRFKKGDKIYGQFIHAPIGEGSYAEYVVVPEKAAITIAPSNISAAEAAAVPTAGMTSQQMLEKMELKKGDVLLINGATGGVGSFATELAAAEGLTVIATASDEANAERMKRLGADVVLDYKKSPVSEQVKALYPQGINGIIDLAGDAKEFTTHLDLLKEGGVAYTTMFVADEEAIKAKGLRGGNFETQGSPASLDKLTKLIEAGKLTIPVESRITLEEVPEAISLSRQAKGKGKTVIIIA